MVDMWGEDVTIVLRKTFCNIHVYQISTFYTLSSHSVLCQLYLNKAGKKEKKKKKQRCTLLVIKWDLTWDRHNHFIIKPFWLKYMLKVALLPKQNKFWEMIIIVNIFGKTYYMPGAVLSSLYTISFHLSKTAKVPSRLGSPQVPIKKLRNLWELAKIGGWGWVVLLLLIKKVII